METQTLLLKPGVERIERVLEPAMREAPYRTWKEPVVGSPEGARWEDSPIYAQIARSREFDPMEDEVSPGEAEELLRQEQIRTMKEANRQRRRTGNRSKAKRKRK